MNSLLSNLKPISTLMTSSKICCFLVTYNPIIVYKLRSSCTFRSFVSRIVVGIFKSSKQFKCYIILAALMHQILLLIRLLDNSICFLFIVALIIKTISIFLFHLHLGNIYQLQVVILVKTDLKF